MPTFSSKFRLLFAAVATLAMLVTAITAAPSADARAGVPSPITIDTPIIVTPDDGLPGEVAIPQIGRGSRDAAPVAECASRAACDTDSEQTKAASGDSSCYYQGCDQPGCIGRGSIVCPGGPVECIGRGSAHCPSDGIYMRAGG